MLWPFYNELTLYPQYKKYPPFTKPICRNTLVKTVLPDYWIYPVLPTLFALDAIYQFTRNKKRSKAELFTPNMDFPSLEAKVYHNQFLSWMPLIGKSLIKSLSYVLESIYTPTPLPMPLEYIFPFLDEVTPDQADFDKSEQDCFSLQKDFVLPICHTDQLAVDLASFCGLTIEQALDLSKSLPSYLIDAQMP